MIGRIRTAQDTSGCETAQWLPDRVSPYTHSTTCPWKILIENILISISTPPPPHLNTRLYKALAHPPTSSLQLKAKHPETFTPNVISFTAPEYESMVRTLHLPYRAIEGTSVVGPFFWCAHDAADDGDAYLQVVMRKSDVRKKGKTRGWELMLSHAFSAGVTTGYVKGTDSSEMGESVAHLRALARQAAHPFLLPMIILSHDLSPKTDQKQRDARDWLRRLEHAVSMRNEIVEDEGYVKDAVMDLDQINRDLVECHSQVLWKRPQAYQEIIKEMEKGMGRFWEKIPKHRGPESLERRVEEDGRVVVKDEYYFGELDRCHRSMLSRLEFYRNKLVGIENYAHTTLERLAIQRSAVSTPYGQERRSGQKTRLTGDSCTTLSPRRSQNSTCRWPLTSGVWPTPASGTARR